ncbi:hypothetical protein DF159_29315, partial [Burkholderia ubonensis]
MYQVLCVATNIHAVISDNGVMAIVAYDLRMIHACMNRTMTFDGEFFVLPYSFTTVATYRKSLVIPNSHGFVVLDLFAAVMPDEGGFVVVDVDVLVLLRVDVDFLLIGL